MPGARLSGGQGCYPACPGDDHADWAAYDAVELIKAGARVLEILVDQGAADEFLEEGQLLPETLKEACGKAGIRLELRRQQGYNNDHHFMATFIGGHIAFHARALAN